MAASSMSSFRIGRTAGHGGVVDDEILPVENRPQPLGLLVGQADAGVGLPFDQVAGIEESYAIQWPDASS